MKVIFEGGVEEFHNLISVPATVPVSIAPNALDFAIGTLYDKREVITAIKLHRVVYNSGLREAKEYCDKVFISFKRF